jgi:general secretion pathway protein H
LHARPHAGFTLVELLVVIVILATAAALVVVNVGGSDARSLGREAKRFAGALEHVRAAAQWRSETLGVSADGGGYRFWKRGADDRWSAIDGDDVLAPRALPAGMALAAQSYAGAPVAADAILPFRASGRNEPYVLTLDSAAGRVVISCDPAGTVRYTEPAAAAPR